MGMGVDEAWRDNQTRRVNRARGTHVFFAGGANENYSIAANSDVDNAWPHAGTIDEFAVPDEEIQLLTWQCLGART
jgi:hypothetical protein